MSRHGSKVGELVERLISVRDGLANPSSRQTLADAANALVAMEEFVSYVRDNALEDALNERAADLL